MILGIETSCDETSAAIITPDYRILSSVVSSQADLHALWGGVVPEVASRRHLELIIPVIDQALREARLGLGEIKGIAVTNRPGLIGALIVGVSTAKALALTRGIPIVGVHHLDGHLLSARLANPLLKPPIVALIVSGGHTEIVLVEDWAKRWTLGRTRDDAAGECFDKSARILDLPYPGGPSIEKAAKLGKKDLKLPRAWMGDSYEFSFSGLKTAVARLADQTTPSDIPDIALSLQDAIVDVLVAKTLRAALEFGVNQVCIVGGVAANLRLKEVMGKAAKLVGVDVTVPGLDLCTDNAAMIAAAGQVRLSQGANDGLELDVWATEFLPLHSTKTEEAVLA